MDVDDLVIGSGISALGVVLGLLQNPERRVGVVTGPAAGKFAYYDARRVVPCAYLGEGGLGTHWHGVIPTGWTDSIDRSAFESMFARFYPHAARSSRFGCAGTFVPWRAIRPAQELRRLARLRPAARLRLISGVAANIRFDERGVDVEVDGRPLRAARGWIAAGALHTPALVSALSRSAVRGCVSDHVFCYVGQVEGQGRPELLRSRDGIYYPARYDAARTALYTERPAAFAYRRLDYGIEQRAVFGLPTGSAVTKIMRRLSPGLLVEAMYNRFGLFGGTRLRSIYAQVRVPDAYDHCGGDTPLAARVQNIRRATDAARSAQPFADLKPSQRPALYIPGIHLHHSLDLEALRRDGINAHGSPLQVVDASILDEIGPNHHSFAMMLASHRQGLSAGLAR